MKRLQVHGTELWCDDRGSGLPLLLVHGFPLDHTMWAGQLEPLRRISPATGGSSAARSGEGPVAALAHRRLRLIAPDLPGFGRSPACRAGNWDPPNVDGNQRPARQAGPADRHDGAIRRRSGRAAGRPGNRRAGGPLRAVDGGLHRAPVLAEICGPLAGPDPLRHPRRGRPARGRRRPTRHGRARAAGRPGAAGRFDAPPRLGRDDPAGAPAVGRGAAAGDDGRLAPRHRRRRPRHGRAPRHDRRA